MLIVKLYVMNYNKFTIFLIILALLIGIGRVSLGSVDNNNSYNSVGVFFSDSPLKNIHNKRKKKKIIRNY